MRIITITEGYPPVWGGGSIYAYEIPKRLARHGIKTLVVTGKASRSYKDEKNAHVSVMRLDVPKYKTAGFSFNTKRFKFILEAIKTGARLRDKYDVYHFHSGMASKVVAWTLRNIYRIKKPFVMTFHGTFIGYYKKLYPFPISSMFDFLSKRIMIDSKCDRYIVVDDGTHAYELLINNGVPKTRVKKHYQTVDCEKFRPMKKKKRKKKEKVIGYIGRLDPMKGVDIFIKSLPTVFEKFDNLKVVIVGDGPLKPELKNLVKKFGLSSKINFIGSIPHSKMPKHINMFDCLIFTDIRSFDNRDLISLTHCEAMACGALMLNPSKPRKEWKCQTWIQVVNPDPNEVAMKILDVLGKPKKYEKMRKDARKVALKYFNWDNVIKLYHNEFNELILSNDKK